MQKSDKAPRKVSTLEQYISRAEKVRSKNEQLKQQYSAELSDLKAETKGSPEKMQDKEFQADITRLATLRDIAGENIEEAENEIQELQAEMEQALAIQERKQNFDKAVKLTKRADNLRKKQNELIKQFDEAVTPILNELADIRDDWKAKSFTFMRTLSQMEPSFRKRISDKLNKDERRKRSEIRRELLQKIEADAGVSINAARREGYLDWKQWNNLFKAELDVQDSEFGAHGLTSKVLNKRNQQAERKKQRQMQKLQNEANESEAAE